MNLEESIAIQKVEAEIQLGKMTEYIKTSVDLVVALKMRAIEYWLQSCVGGPPAQVHLTNPKQQFNIVCDVSGLMRILGGEWLRVIADAEAKASAQAGRRGIQTEGEEGNFLGSVKKFKTTPPDFSEAGLNADYSARNETTK